jgi:hypothetical protein
MSIIYSPNILKDDLILYLDENNLKSLPGLGKRGSYSTSPFIGKISMFMIYQRQLTYEQIYNHYNETKGRFWNSNI